MAVLACTMSAVLGGCGSQAASAVREVSARFHAAVGSQDGEGACALLAPHTRGELEQASGLDCATAILEAGVAEPSRVAGTAVFGGHAQVRSVRDTTFLARFPDGWKIVAVACEPQQPRPYDCAISGG